MTSRDRPDYNNIKIGQNTEQSPGDLRRHCCHSDFSENLGKKNSEKIGKKLGKDRKKLGKDREKKLGKDRKKNSEKIGKKTRKRSEKINKNRYDWVGKMIHWELYTKFKFDYTIKWFMKNSEFILVNVIYKFLSDFEIKTDNLISARRTDQEIVNKKENLPNKGLCRSGTP